MHTSTQVQFEAEPTLTEDEYRLSRVLFLIEGCTGMAVYTLTSGAFLAGFFSYLGISDRFNGIFASFPVLLGITQLFGPLFLEKLGQRKRITLILGISYRLLLAAMFVIPLLMKEWRFTPALTAGIYGLSSLISPFFTLAIYNWIISLAPDNIRGRYLGLKDALSYIFLTVVNIIMGWVLDFFKAQGDLDQGFMVCGIVVAVLTFINAGAVFLAKEPWVPVDGRPITPWDVVKTTLNDRGFRKIIFFYILWNFSFQFAWPFINVYLVSGLRLDYTYIMTMGFITNALRVATNHFWGRLADRKSWELTTKLSLSLLAVSFSLLFFMNQETVHFFFPLYSILSGIAWGGVGIATFSLQFNYTPVPGRTIYLATNTAIGGLCGFAGTLMSSSLIGMIGKDGFRPFGFHLGSMQIIFLISGFLLIVSSLFVHFRLRTKK